MPALKLPDLLPFLAMTAPAMGQQCGYIHQAAGRKRGNMPGVSSVLATLGCCLAVAGAALAQNTGAPPTMDPVTGGYYARQPAQSLGIYGPAGTSQPGGAPPTGGASPQEAPLSLTTWTDPREGAITASVPNGWTVNGGLTRAGQIDVRVGIALQSADRAISVFYGDPRLGNFEVPNQWQPEGQTTYVGATTLTMMNYIPAGEFARRYLAQNLCPQANQGASHDMPDAARALANGVIDANAGSEYAAQVRADVAEIAYTCGDRIGLVRAGTQLSQPAGNGPGIPIWSVPLLTGYTASDADHARLAWRVMEHLVATVQYSPAWEQGYREQVRRITGQTIGEMNAFLSGVMQRARAADEIAVRPRPSDGGSGTGRGGDLDSERPNSILGTKWVCTTETSACKQVSTDHTCYWKHDNGRVAPGPESGSAPDNSGHWHSMGC